MNGFASVMGESDELCNFELLKRTDEMTDCGEETGTGAMAGQGCTHRLDFAREVLKEGLREKKRLGVNPYKMGFIGSTDTHAGIPGATEEDIWQGHIGISDDEPSELVGPTGFVPGGIRDSAGGLAAVWAVENSRDALFDSMRSKETYATSGTRPTVRFFGGHGYTPAMCDGPDLAAHGYDKGVPMGGDLKPAADGAAPSFLVSAFRDPLSHASPLQRIQIIKGWLNADGTTAQKVYEVAGDPNNGAAADPLTCERSGDGFSSLCAAWTDPEWNSTQPSFYYARVVENPSCRWSQYVCNSLPKGERPTPCDDPKESKTTQERAWTSPIWYAPDA